MSRQVKRLDDLIKRLTKLRDKHGNLPLLTTRATLFGSQYFANCMEVKVRKPKTDPAVDIELYSIADVN